LNAPVTADAFAKVVALLPEAVVLVFADGAIGAANPPAARLLGAPAPQLAGRRLQEFAAEDAAAVAGYLRLCARTNRPVPGALTLAGKAYRCEGALLEPRTASGAALLLMRLIPKDAAVNRFAALNLRIDELAREVARRRRAEAELQERERERLEADRRKDEFLAMLAHELRNPLAVLSSGIQVLRGTATQPPAGDPAARVVQAMERQIAHLARLVDDLLDVSRMTRGRMELRKAPTPLEGLLQQAAESVLPAIQARGLALRLEPPAEPATVDADAARLAQVFGNLLSNAAKFSAPGGSIVVRCESRDGEARVSVRDTGAGIAPEMLDAVFELFVQADHSIARSQGGLGVGLAIARRITELHGGSIEARSEGPGRGSEFIVRLPLARAPVPGPAEAAPAPASGSKRILVVDDNVDAAQTLALMLQSLGHEVRVVFDGASALQLDGELRPDVVLLDIGLPGMDGYEVARRLRERATRRLVIAVSGYGTEADRRRSRDAGFDHHLTKPVALGTLAALIARS
jgi:two-component system CheB/CheR fusion protein